MTQPPPSETPIMEKCEDIPQRTEEEIRRLSQRAHAWDKLIKSRGERYRECLLGNYDVTCEKQEAVVNELQVYGEHISVNTRVGRGIVLFGPAGTGKDHLLMALARVAITNDLDAGWKNGMDFFASVRDSFGNDDQREAELVDQLTKPTILILSDPLPPSGPLTDFQRNVLFRAIDKRYCHLKPTWVTLNCTGRTEADDRMGAQIMDRLVHDSLRLFCDWESYRTK